MTPYRMTAAGLRPVQTSEECHIAAAGVEVPPVDLNTIKPAGCLKGIVIVLIKYGFDDNV